MARWIGAGALLVFALVQLVASEDFDACTFENDTCTEDHDHSHCMSSDNGECTQLSLHDDDLSISAIITCNADGTQATFDLYADDSCAGSVVQNNTIAPTGCREFMSTGIYFSIKCHDHSDEPSDDPCFSGESKVNLADGSQKKVREVQVGDLVESFTADGRHTFSKVFHIQHKENDKFASMKTYHYETVDGSVSGAITLTKNHLVRQAGDQDLYMASQEMKQGQKIMVQVAGKESAVEATVVEISKNYGTVRNILTMNDRIVVDGVLASTGTDVLPLWVQKMLMGPLKMFYSVGLGRVTSSLDTFVHKAFVSYKKGSISA